MATARFISLLKNSPYSHPYSGVVLERYVLSEGHFGSLPGKLVKILAFKQLSWGLSGPWRVFFRLSKNVGRLHPRIPVGPHMAQSWDHKSMDPLPYWADFAVVLIYVYL